jgi:hypothetical protein
MRNSLRSGEPQRSNEAEESGAVGDGVTFSEGWVIVNRKNPVSRLPNTRYVPLAVMASTVPVHEIFGFPVEVISMWRDF